MGLQPYGVVFSGCSTEPQCDGQSDKMILEDYDPVLTLRGPTDLVLTLRDLSSSELVGIDSAVESELSSPWVRFT